MIIADLHWGGFTINGATKYVSIGRMKSIQWVGLTMQNVCKK